MPAIWGYIALDRATIEAELTVRGYQRLDHDEEERYSASVIANRKPGQLIHIWRSANDRIEVDELADINGDLWTRIDARRDLDDYAMGATVLDGEWDRELWHAQFGHTPDDDDDD